jgi:hypothetical protein
MISLQKLLDIVCTEADECSWGGEYKELHSNIGGRCDIALSGPMLLAQTGAAEGGIRN